MAILTYLTRPSHFKSPYRQNPSPASGNLFYISGTFLRVRVVQTYPLGKAEEAWHSALEDVPEMPPAKKGRQGAPLL